MQQLVKPHIASRLKGQDWAIILQNLLRNPILESAPLSAILQTRNVMDRLPEQMFDFTLHTLLFQSGRTDISTIAGFVSDHNLYRIKKLYGDLFWVNTVKELISSGKVELAAYLVTLHLPFLLVPTESYEAFLGFLFEKAKTEPVLLESLKNLHVESPHASDHWFNFVHDCLKEERFDVVLGILPFAKTKMTPEAHAKLRLELIQLAPGVPQSKMSRILAEPHPLTRITSFVSSIPDQVGSIISPTYIRSSHPSARRLNGGPRAAAGALHQRIPVVQAPRNPLLSTLRGLPIGRL
jgi:hypothetical protein